MRLCSLSSGSRGNCVVVQAGDSTIITDIGIPVSKIKKSLIELNAKNIYVLVTHSHIDHIHYLPAFLKEFSAPVFCHPDTYPAVKRKTLFSNITPFDGDFYIGEVTVSPFNVSHDVPCVGYSFYHMQKKISLATDLGCITNKQLDAISGSSLVFLESNHDENMLLKNHAYPYKLKRRILSDKGHLSNTTCAKACLQIVRDGAKQIVLGHLSAENNTPDLAKSVTHKFLLDNGVNEGDITVSVAEYNKVSPIFTV